MRRIFLLLIMSLAPAASAQVHDPVSGYPGAPEQAITVRQSGYACTAVGHGPSGYRSFEATAFGANAYTRAYYLALGRCEYAFGYGYRDPYGYGSPCRVTQCNRMYF